MEKYQTDIHSDGSNEGASNIMSFIFTAFSGMARDRAQLPLWEIAHVPLLSLNFSKTKWAQSTFQIQHHYHKELLQRNLHVAPSEVVHRAIPDYFHCQSYTYFFQTGFTYQQRSLSIPIVPWKTFFPVFGIALYSKYVLAFISRCYWTKTIDPPRIWTTELK